MLQGRCYYTPLIMLSTSQKSIRDRRRRGDYPRRKRRTVEGKASTMARKRKQISAFSPKRSLRVYMLARKLARRLSHPDISAHHLSDGKSRQSQSSWISTG